MGGVCRLWSQHIAVDEPLRSQTCQAKFANRRCVCEPSNRVCEPPTRSLRTMTGVCEPNQVSRTSREPKAGGTNFHEWIYTILATIQTPSIWPWIQFQTPVFNVSKQEGDKPKNGATKITTSVTQSTSALWSHQVSHNSCGVCYSSQHVLHASLQAVLDWRFCDIEDNSPNWFVYNNGILAASFLASMPMLTHLHFARNDAPCTCPANLVARTLRLLQ